jgi:hypothetical protein
MDRKFITLFGAALLAMAADAQTQAGAQAGTQADASMNAKQASQSARASSSSSGAAQSNESSASIADSTAINAALSAPVDSKKAKPGDEVTARTTEAVKAQGKTVVPKGAKLVGHVTRASARGRGDADSALGIAFDKAILKNGQEVPLSGSIQALASAETAAGAAGTDLDAVSDVGAGGGGRVMSGGRGALGGVASTTGGAVGSVTNTAGNAASAGSGAVGAAAKTTTGAAGSATPAVGGINSAGQFASNSRGVFGLNGVNLNAAGSNSTEGSLITSGGKNVRLDSGTRMLIVSGAQAGEANSPAGGGQKSQPRADSKQPNKQ